mgnify:FL=1
MKVKLSMPEHLGDITLREYKRYDRIINTNKEDANSERFVQTKMVEIFCGLTYEQAAAMKLIDFNRVVTELYDILIQQPKLVQTFKMGDREFGFIPNLEEMTFGEYIDLDTYITKMQEMEKAMSVLYRPITQKIKDKYIIQEYQGDLLHDEMLNMPMDAVVSSIVFFYDLGIELSNVMMNYTNNPQLKAYQQQLMDSQKSGGGFNPYTHWHTEILGDLNK